MQLPREIIVGEDTLELVGEVCKKLGFCETAFVVTGPKTYHIAGKTVVELLSDSDIKVEHCIVSSTTIKNVESVEKEMKELDPQVVLGVGGGTKIDIAKLSSAHLEVPFISVPTTISHDGIGSPLASVKGLKRPYSVIAQSPMAIVADTEVIARAPYRFAASGFGDVVSKLTSIRDWERAYQMKGEYFGGYAASLAQMSVTLVSKDAELLGSGSENGFRVLLEALISCGVAMSIAGSSRPASGSEHLFSHALDHIAPGKSLHGERCGVGTIMMAKLQGLDWKRVRKMLEKVGAPTTAEELQVDGNQLVDALVQARYVRPDRYTILSEKILNLGSAKKLAKATGVIL
jgi:glycerol-1-phosphate dehydrogenase [NAD(P)+]